MDPPFCIKVPAIENVTAGRTGQSEPIGVNAPYLLWPGKGQAKACSINTAIVEYFILFYHILF